MVATPAFLFNSLDLGRQGAQIGIVQKGTCLFKRGKFSRAVITNAVKYHIAQRGEKDWLDDSTVPVTSLKEYNFLSAGASFLVWPTMAKPISLT